MHCGSCPGLSRSSRNIDHPVWGIAMQHHMIAGGGGLLLHLVETGKPAGRPILFLHGFSQSWYAWSSQLDSDLAADYRLIAMDLRGHGHSDKPRGCYADSRLWADDLDAAIRSLGLEQPLAVRLVLWTADDSRLRASLRGRCHRRYPVRRRRQQARQRSGDGGLAPDFLGLVPCLLATGADEAVAGLWSLLDLCYAREPAREARYVMLGYSVSVPTYVRQALLDRSFDNEDLLRESVSQC